MKTLVTVIMPNRTSKQLCVFTESSLDDAAKVAVELLGAFCVRRVQRPGFVLPKSKHGKGNHNRF